MRLLAMEFTWSDTLKLIAVDVELIWSFVMRNPRQYKINISGLTE